VYSFKRILLGRRLASSEVQDTKINNAIGLSIFSSDALSSVAYASQEIIASLSNSLVHLGVIAAGGMLVHPLFRLSIPVAIGIVLLLIILGMSYRQTISAYPTGGGAYVVAQNNLGETASLVAGASLLIDYVLTVAVSVSSGVANFTSAITFLKGHEVTITIIAILVIALTNLRGMKNSGKLFAVPTYGFILLMMILLGTGTIKAIIGPAPTREMIATSVNTTASVSQFALVLLFLRAFSSGCTALTGIETISSGVAAFKGQSARNASKIMFWMIALLAVMFMGVTLLADHFNIIYAHSGNSAVISETLLSKLARAIYGDVSAGFTKVLYVTTMGFTFMILIVAANSSYVGFPMLSAIMGHNRYLPNQLANQGDRLVFSNGIMILTIASCSLVWLLNANTDLLLPLYAVGVFTGFTLSQTGMVVHWWKQKKSGKKWLTKAIINGIGAVTTAIVWLDIVILKFKVDNRFGGVWVVLLTIPILVYCFMRIHRHYVRVNALLAISRTEAPALRKNRVIVLVNRIHYGTLEAIRYAKVIAEGGKIEALCIDCLDEFERPSPARQALEADWPNYSGGIPLRIIENKYRQIVEPIIDELNKMRANEPDLTYTFVLPEFVTDSFLGNILHNQTALRLKTVLRPIPNTVVVSVPYQIS